MTVSRHSEAAFETVIEHHLLNHGYITVPGEGFDRERAIFPSTVLDFIRETQPKEWAKLEALHGAKTGEQILGDLCKWMDSNGSLATLRHGFKCYGRTLFVAYFKAAHELNPELEGRYSRNRLGLTRQLHFSTRSEKSLDVTLSVNGIPVATLELKNAMTGQTVEHARRQYKQDRDPREPIFEFKKRTLVHFAVDTDAVLMTTRLAGNATHFLPFNKGDGGGAGKVLIGVGPDGRLVGQEVADITLRDIAAMLGRFEPAARVEMSRVDIDNGRQVIVLTAAPSRQFAPFVFESKPYKRVGSTTTVMSQEEYARLLLDRNHSRHRWENQAAVGVQLEDLDREEILCTRAAAIEQRRLSAGTSMDVGDILDRLGLRVDGQITQAAQMLYGTKFLPNYPQGLLKLGRFRGTKITGDILDNKHEHLHAFAMVREAIAWLDRTLPLSARFPNRSSIRVVIWCAISCRSPIRNLRF